LVPRSVSAYCSVWSVSLVTIVAKAAQTYLGAAGLYLAGALAGLTDVDAISLSMANLAAANPESLVVAARAIIIAVLANTLVKAGMAVFMGAPALRRTIVLVTVLCCSRGLPEVSSRDS
jgi:uncharacterized membrane protein (DUF4010 family)